MSVIQSNCSWGAFTPFPSTFDVGDGSVDTVHEGPQSAGHVQGKSAEVFANSLGGPKQASPLSINQQCRTPDCSLDAINIKANALPRAHQQSPYPLKLNFEKEMDLFGPEFHSLDSCEGKQINTRRCHWV